MIINIPEELLPEVRCISKAGNAILHLKRIRPALSHEINKVMAALIKLDELWTAYHQLNCGTCKFGEEGVCYNCYGVDGVTEISSKGTCINYERDDKNRIHQMPKV